MANVFIADKDLNVVFMNAGAKKSLKRVESSLRNVFKVSIDDILEGSIHRFHKGFGKAEVIFKNPSIKNG
jgi:methyl-accepting chemotaxis protein